MPLAALRRATGRARTRLGTQDGSMLIEVLIGALILAIVTAAVLDGLDGAQATGRANKDRSVAATLAQQDVERLRALPISALVGLEQTRAVDVNGVKYTVTSKTTWMRDNSGELSCTDDTSQASFLKVVSTAWSPASSERPVAETTLITPSAAYSQTTGTVTIKVTDRDGAPRAGVQIALTGPASYAATTNALGCAIFSFIPIGTYTAKPTGTWVDVRNSSPVSEQVPVVAGKTTAKHLVIESPIDLQVTFKSPAGTTVQWDQASVVHVSLGAGRRYGTFNALRSSLKAGTLFPFTDGYGVYAGSCMASDPGLTDPDYYLGTSSHTGQIGRGVTTFPVVAQLAQITVYVKRLDSQSIRLQLDQIDDLTEKDDPNCPAHLYARTGNGRRDGIVLAAVKKPTKTVVSPIETVAIAVPVGKHRLCFDDDSRHAPEFTLTVTSPTNVTYGSAKSPVDLSNLSGSATKGDCVPGF